MSEEPEFDIVAAFGGEARGERFAIYVPNKDQYGQPVDQAPWIQEALELFSDIGGGATAMPPVTGAWLNPETKRLITEEPVVVYSYVYPEMLMNRFSDLVDFVRRLGRETRQGAVGLEYGGTFFTVENFD